jgi:carboxylate-amine ligase
VLRTAAIVALVQALVVAYGDAHRVGEPEPYLPGAYLEDLRWKGMRFGLDADVIDAETSEVISMPEFVGRMVEVARPAAEKLGTIEYFDVVSEILRAGNGATRQRAALLEEGGDIRQLQLRLLREAAEKGIRDPESVPS